RRSDVDADLVSSIRQRSNGERIVDLRRRCIVDRECPHGRYRQIGKLGRILEWQKSRAVGKNLEQKTIEVVLGGRRDRTTCGKQRQRVCLQRIACRVDRTCLQRKLVRLVERGRELVAESGGQSMLLELGHVCLDLLSLSALAFQTRKRSLECVARSGTVAPL